MKKQTKQDIIIIGSILLFLLLGLIVFITLNDKEKPFKTVITKTFEVIDKGVDGLKNTPDFQSDNKVTLDLTDSKETISLNLDYSPKNKYIKLNGTLGNNNLTYYYENNNSYLKSPDLSNTYSINYNFKACTEEECLDNAGNLNDIIANSFLTTNINYKDLNRTVTNLEKVFLKSIDKHYITKKSMTTSINNVDTKTTRYSYLLNKNSLSILLNNIDHNKNLKDDIFNLFGDSLNAVGITKDNFKNIIDIEDNLGTLNIYTTSYNNIAKVNLSLVNGVNITVNITKDITTIDYTLSTEISGKITVNNNTKKTDITYYYKGNNAIELEISKENNTLHIDYNIYVGDNKYTGTITNKLENPSNDSFTGTLTINDITLKYNIVTTNDIAKEDISTSTKYEEITPEDALILENIIKDIENDNLINSIVNGIKALEN